MKKSYKYRIYPNVKQKTALAKTFGCVRAYWNMLVDSFNSYDKDTNKSPHLLTVKEVRNSTPWMKEPSANALNRKREDFRNTKNQFFNKNRKARIGRMSFKKKSGNQSFSLDGRRFKIKEGKIKLEKISAIRIKMHREIPKKSKILSVTISKNPSGQYFASINFDLDHKPKIKNNKENVGIDLGVKEIATLSSGVQFANPKYFRESQSKLRKAQKHLGRKKKGSNRWEKQRIKVAKIHQKIVDQRDWYLHNISRHIVETFNEVGMEDLSVINMMKNKKLSKSVSDTSMSKLKTFISYKQKEYDKEVVLLDRFKPSTKECSKCENIQEVRLSERIFECNNCGKTLDRDLNAAINIQRKTVGGVDSTLQTWSDIKTMRPDLGAKQLQRSV